MSDSTIIFRHCLRYLHEFEKCCHCNINDIERYDENIYANVFCNVFIIFESLAILRVINVFIRYIVSENLTLE
jgi:hypothetical protein